MTLTAPGSVPGSAVDEPDAVTTTAPSSGSRAPNQTTRSPGGQPDAGHAAAGAALRAHAVGAEVQQLGVGGDEAERLLAGAQLDGADHLVAVLEPDTSHSSRLASTSGLTRLTTPWRVPSASPGPSVAQRGQRERPARRARAAGPR